jgi:hypothetical protein
MASCSDGQSVETSEFQKAASIFENALHCLAVKGVLFSKLVVTTQYSRLNILLRCMMSPLQKSAWISKC